MLESWKYALNKVSYYMGEIINNECGREEGVMKVVSCVLKKLKIMRLDVAKYPMGLDRVEKDFENIALQSTGPIQIVGIWGMGGAGKTTLAKHLYNKKCSTKKSSFLFDVRDAAFKGQLHEKQKKLLEDLGLKAGSLNFDNKEEGKGILRNNLESVPVLIVLDDVDHIDQLDALLPARETLGDGSLIIVTTRDLHVLEVWDISAIYKISPLDPYSSQELFCLHAFGQPSPLIDFEELAKKFTNACCGLPLSLKVLGSLLHGNSSKEDWQAQLDKLLTIKPEDINSRLRISYDALENEEKKMFLDVACFFIGWPSSSAIEVWDSSHWNGLSGWKTLKSKCLVELNENNEIRMHDHLRDLGREIANKQSPYRLWSNRQIIKIQPQQESIQIRGLADPFRYNRIGQDGKIRLNTSEGERILVPGLVGLKIFIGEGDFINEKCSGLSKELLCFRCNRFEHKSLPSWLPFKELRILELLNPQQLEDLWESDEDAPLELRQLLIREGRRLKKISSLQRFGLLKTLYIEDCPELKTIPTLAGLTALKKIYFRRCIKLEKIESREGLRSLQTFHIEHCPELKTIPTLAGSTSLENIYLKSCIKLEKIKIREGLGSLQTLHIEECRELKTIPTLAGLTALKFFYLRCFKFEKIESIEGLGSLQTLNIEIWTKLKTIPSLAGLTSLEKIYLKFCIKLEKIESIEGLRSLQTLHIEFCLELKTIPTLAGLTSLENIYLKSCIKLEKIEGIEGLGSLQTLHIEDCTELKTLPSLVGSGGSLQTLHIKKCTELKTLPSLVGLGSLQTLHIEECTELKTLQSLVGLTSLQKIYLTRCTKLEKIEIMKGLRSLEVLNIKDCPALDTVPSLRELISLEEFELSGCSRVEKVEGLEVLRSLKKVEVHMWSMRPCMLKLPEQSERLKSVQVAGNSLVGVEASIREIQKWEREEIICTRAVIDVRNFFNHLHPEDVVHTCGSREAGIKLQMPESAWDGNAILICFIIHSIHPNLRFGISMVGMGYAEFHTEMSNGEWVVMGILPQESIWVWMGILPQISPYINSMGIWEQKQSFWEQRQSILEACYSGATVEEGMIVEEAWSMRGTEHSIREAFHHLSHRDKLGGQLDILDLCILLLVGIRCLYLSPNIHNI